MDPGSCGGPLGGPLLEGGVQQRVQEELGPDLQELTMARG